MKGTDLAPDGTVWVCGACGKRARSRYGFDAAKKSTRLDAGWDESCMLNAVLCVDGLILPWRAVVPQPPRSPADGAENSGNDPLWSFLGVRSSE